MDIISMVGQIIAFLTAFYVSFMIYRKKINYIGNKLFFISFMIFGFYALVLFLYEFPVSLLFNEIAIRLSLLLIVGGMLIFVLSMQVFTKGSLFLKTMETKVLIIITIIILVLTFIFPYRVYQITPEIIADKNLVSLLSTGVWSILLMIYNAIRIFMALREIEDSNQAVYRKIKFLGIAQLIALISPLMSIIGNITKNSFIHALMFIFLAIPILIVGMVISKQKENN